jgi:formate hydrogenlyase subunit 4
VIALDPIQIAIGIIQTLVLVILAPLLTGIVRKTKARTQKRVGSSILQPYYDMIKLMKKDEVVSESSSWIFRASPWINFVSVVAAACFIPVMIFYSPFGLAGDMLVVIGLFGLGRFFTLLAGLDVASSFGGLGSSREMMMSALIEPAFFITIFALSLTLGGTNLSTMVESAAHSTILAPSMIFAAISFFIIILAESGRLPFDNPATHLELTMMHEATILEYSGKSLALIEWSQSIKQMVLLGLFVNLFVPFGVSTAVSFAVLGIGLMFFIAKTAFLSILIAFIETKVAKWRLFRVPDLISMAVASSIIGVIFFYLK